MRGERVVTWVVVAGALWLALYAALTAAAQRWSGLAFLVGDALYLVPIVCAAVLSVFAAGRTIGRVQVAWRVLAVSNVLWLAGEMSWVAYDTIRPGGAPVPSVADVFWMLRYVVALAAVLIGLRVGSLLRGASALLDAVLVAVGVAALSWRLFISALIPGTWTPAAVATLAYAVFAVSIMSVVIGVLLSGHRRVPVSMLLVSAAFGVSAIGDMGFSYLVVANSYSTAFAGASWWNMFWEAAAVLMCLAAVLAAQQREGAAERPELDRDVAVLPALVAVITVGGLALADSARMGRLNPLTLGVAGLMVAGLLVRQSMALRDRTRMADTLHRAAITDGLTALYNRRFMEEMLRIEAERAVRNRTLLSLILLDLDRFKSINDEYGHAVGDAALVQTADRLRGAVRACRCHRPIRWRGVRYRLLPDTGGTLPSRSPSSSGWRCAARQSRSGVVPAHCSQPPLGSPRSSRAIASQPSMSVGSSTKRIRPCTGPRRVAATRLSGPGPTPSRNTRSSAPAPAIASWWALTGAATLSRVFTRIAPHLRPWRVVVASVALLGLWACGFGPSTGGSDPAAVGDDPLLPDPCQLLTPEEIGAVQGGPTDPGVPGTGQARGHRACVFGQQNDGKVTTITVFAGGQARFDQERDVVAQNFPVEDIPGLGDDAFIGASGTPRPQGRTHHDPVYRLPSETEEKEQAVALAAQGTRPRRHDYLAHLRTEPAVMRRPEDHPDDVRRPVPQAVAWSPRP